jgi:hypothetical protein
MNFLSSFFKDKSSESSKHKEYKNQSFSGCDMVASIDMTLPNGKQVTSVIGMLQTLTYSIFMEKNPVRSIGNINAKDYVFGPRTMAGSLMFAVFNRHWAYDLTEKIKQADSVGSVHFLVDELLPFNITVSFQNEYGVGARLALYGIRIVSEGQTMSINDIYTENTYQFVATDIDYLSDATGFTSQKTPTIPGLPGRTPDNYNPFEVSGRKPVAATAPPKPAEEVKEVTVNGRRIEIGGLW